MNNRAKIQKSQMMNHIRLYVLTVFLFLTFTAIADFKSELLLANQGDATAQYNLGLMYANGQGVTQSYTEAVKWYRLAADQGFAQAQFNLGNMYANGRGVAKDYVEAERWWRLVADQESPVGTPFTAEEIKMYEARRAERNQEEQSQTAAEPAKESPVGTPFTAEEIKMYEARRAERKQEEQPQATTEPPATTEAQPAPNPLVLQSTQPVEAHPQATYIKEPQPDDPLNIRD